LHYNAFDVFQNVSAQLRAYAVGVTPKTSLSFAAQKAMEAVLCTGRYDQLLSRIATYASMISLFNIMSSFQNVLRRIPLYED
jgi:hypothetical protein